MMMTAKMMMEAIETRFAELATADGYTDWWESEDAWEHYEEQMVEEGLDAEMVASFFEEMAWDM